MSELKESFFPGDEQQDDGPALRGSHVGEPKKRSLLKLLGFTLLAFVLLVTGVVGGIAWYLHDSLSAIDHNIERFAAPNDQIPAAERPKIVAPEAQNYLLLGSDSRISAGDPSQWSFGAQRTDAIMILHIPADRSKAYVVSIPRDSWVTIPGREGKYKINAAFSYGGPTLMVKTVEKLTGVRLDHIVIADFDGFKNITNRLGGVDITIPGEGTRHMDGDEALAYVRTRKTLPNGDFDRVKRQQNWIRTVLGDLLSKDTVKSPKTLMDSLKMLSKSVATDDDFEIGEMRDLAWSMKSVRAHDVTFMTVPVKGTGWSPDHKQSIVLLDPAADGPLFDALRKDTMSDYLGTYQPDLLGTKVN